MKKIILLGAATMFATSSFAYTPGDGDKKNTLEIQGKGLANSSFLFNKNISDAAADQDYAAGWSFNYGLGVSMYFGNVGFGIEGLLGNQLGAYAGTVVKKDSLGNPTSKNYSSTVNLKVTEIPILFKLKSDIGGYLEIGPQYNIISEASYHYKDDKQTDTITIMTSNFARSYFSAVLGFGFKIPVAKSNFSVIAGVRLQFAFTDIKGVDALGVPFDNLFKYKTHEQTAAAAGGLMLGVVYTLGEKKKDK